MADVSSGGDGHGEFEGALPISHLCDEAVAPAAARPCFLSQLLS